MKLRCAPLVVALVAGTAALVAGARDARAIGQATGRVSGTVIEAESKVAVPGATVTMTGGSGVRKQTSTSEDGSYSFDFIPRAPTTSCSPTRG